MAAPLGVSVPTITEWLAILETTGQILLVPPYYENFGKRLIKSPKLYLTDSGLACHLLGIESPRDLEASPFRGAVFEGFVASEIVKQQINRGERRELYYFRDQRGLEVDFLVPGRGRRLIMLEAKASRTVYPEAGRSLRSLAENAARAKPECIVVHDSKERDAFRMALAPGVKVANISGMLAALVS